QGAAGWLERARIGAGEVAAECLPTHASVTRAVDMLRGDEHHVRVVPRRGHRKRPLEAILQPAGAPTHGIVWPDRNIVKLAAAVVVARQVSAEATRVNRIRITRSDGNMPAFATSDGVPVGSGDGR